MQRYCSNYIASWSSKAIPVDKIWCDVLFMRSVVAIKSALILIHHDAVDDAAIIVRTVFEIEFQLGAIKSDPQMAVRLIQGAEGARLKRLKRFRDSGRPLPEGVTAEEIGRQPHFFFFASLSVKIRPVEQQLVEVSYRIECRNARRSSIAESDIRYLALRYQPINF